MEGLKQKGSRLLEAVADYTESSIRLIAFKSADKTARISSNFLMIVILVIIFLFTFNLLNIGFALLISILLDKSWAGFMVLGGFYAVLGILIYVMRDKLIFQPLLNATLQSILGTALKAEEGIEKVQDKIEDKLNLEKQPD
ncbi:MAG: hypothetical protein ABI729_09350 [Chitinophagales bacterium]